MLKVAVIGLGSIGLRHLRNLAALGVKHIICYDPFFKGQVDGLTDSWAGLLAWGPTHAIVCSPPSTHYAQTLALVDRNIRCFVEKPLALEVAEAKDVVAKAASRNVTLAVGYMCRALPELQRLQQYVAGRPCNAWLTCRWHWTGKTYDWPGILVENSHELDLALWLFGPVAQAYGTVKEKSADLILKHRGGSTTALTLVADSAVYERAITVDELNGEWHAEFTLKPEDFDATYRDEVAAFLHGRPLCTGWEALATVELMRRAM